jgi:hypothetical protein
MVVSRKAEVNKIKEDLKSSWNRIVKEVTEDLKYSNAKDSLDWLKFVMENNVPYGKQNR